MIQRRAIHCLIVVVLAACSSEAESPKVTHKQERKEKAEAIARKTPVPRTYQIDGHQLMVVDVPSADGGFVDVQKCFVWRDAEFKTASMQCPGEQSNVVIPGGPTYDHH